MISATNPILAFANNSYKKFDKLPVEKLCDGRSLNWVDFQINKEDHTSEILSVYSKVTNKGHMVVYGEPATIGQNQIMNDDSTLLQEVVIFNLPMQFSALGWLFDNLEEEKSKLEYRIKEKFVDATKSVLKSLLRKDFNERNEVENILKSLGIRVTRNIDKISPKALKINTVDVVKVHEILTSSLSTRTMDLFMNKLQGLGIKTEPKKLRVHLGANIGFYSLDKIYQKVS